MFRDILLGVLFVFIMTNNMFAHFVHPGIDQSQNDLNYMKHLVLSGNPEYVKAFELLKNEVKLDSKIKTYSHIISGPYAKPDIGGKELSESSSIAYKCALLWFITGDDAYAEKAINIIEEWSDVLRSFNENNAKLLVALTGYQFCNAAEILRYNYSGWSQKHTDSMSKLMMSVYYPTICYYFSEANGNWDGAIMHTLMAIAVFMDNKQLFDSVIDHYLHGKCNGSLVKYIYPNGQCQETERDQGHVQMGLYEFSAVARIAYTQGVDLYTVADNRLARGLEYTSAFLIGEDVFAYGTPSERLRLNYSSKFEHVLKHYKSQGIDMPNLANLCDSVESKGKVSSLFKLTSNSYEFIDKEDVVLKELEETSVNFKAGAKVERLSDIGHDVIVVDNQDNLQSIVNEYSGKGKKIYLKAGEYKLDSTLILPSDIYLLGEGRNTVILCKPSVQYSAIEIKEQDANNIIIDNMVIDGALSHEVGYDPNAGRFDRSGRYKNMLSGILIKGMASHVVRNIILKNLTVINFSRLGIYASDAKSVCIEDCDISENGSHVIPGLKLHHNVVFQNVEDLEINGTRIDNSLKGAGVIFKHCNNFIIQSCEIARNAWHGIMFSESSNGKISNCLIEGNDGCGVMGEFLYKGSENISVKHNKIRCNNEFGFKAYSVSNLNVGENEYSWNGSESKQELISSDKILQTDKLR